MFMCSVPPHEPLCLPTVTSPLSRGASACDPACADSLYAKQKREEDFSWHFLTGSGKNQLNSVFLLSVMNTNAVIE